MMKLMAIGAGGAVGSILRYLISGYVQHLTKSVGFPYGTLAVNVLGCFIIGVLFYLADTYGAFSSEARSFIFIGVLGGLTTFSTFGNETMILVRDAQHGLALANIAANLLLCLGSVWLGRVAAIWIWR
jgi:CrcB protein